MNRTSLLSIATIAMATIASAAHANPIFLGGGMAGTPGVFDLASGDGSVGVNGISGYGYTVSLSATGTPTLADPDFATNTLTISSTTAGTITLYASELNDTTTVPSFDIGFNNNPLSDTSVTEAVYADAGNGKYALTTMLGSATLAPGGTNSQVAGFGNLTTPYSLTEAYTITFGAGGGTVDATIIEKAGTAVPEPASLAMLGVGLLGLATMRHRRQA